MSVAASTIRRETAPAASTASASQSWSFAYHQGGAAFASRRLRHVRVAPHKSNPAAVKARPFSSPVTGGQLAGGRIIAAPRAFHPSVCGSRRSRFYVGLPLSRASGLKSLTHTGDVNSALAPVIHRNRLSSFDPSAAPTDAATRGQKLGKSGQIGAA